MIFSILYLFVLGQLFSMSTLGLPRRRICPSQLLFQQTLYGDRPLANRIGGALLSSSLLFFIWIKLSINLYYYFQFFYISCSNFLFISLFLQVDNRFLSLCSYVRQSVCFSNCRKQKVLKTTSEKT